MPSTQRARARRSAALVVAVVGWVAACLAGTASGAPSPTPTSGAAPSAVLSEADRSLLSTSPFVYIASTRKDGALSQPAEIWFMVADGSVWVASSPESWRAKRIRWGRPMAKIWIGKRDGPSFRARGEIVRDTKRYDELCDAFGVKYPERWSRWEKSFRDGLRSGDRVLIRYTPIAG